MENQYCGSCDKFTHEDSNGSGICAFHNEIVLCDDEACNKYLPITFENILETHKDILVRMKNKSYKQANRKLIDRLKS